MDYGNGFILQKMVDWSLQKRLRPCCLLCVIVVEGMKEMKYVNMFNQGTRRVQDMLRENGNPEAEFTVEKLTAFEVKVWPTISLNLVTDQEKVSKSETKASDTVNDILAFCTTPRSMSGDNGAYRSETPV